MNHETRRWIFDAAVWSIGVAMMVVLGAEAIASERPAASPVVAAGQVQCPMAVAPRTSHGKV